MTTALDLFDAALDRAVFPGYTRVGIDLRRQRWSDPDPEPDALRTRTALVTGGGSGIGKATALGLARLGASLHLLVRNEAGGESAAEDIRRAVPGSQVEVVRCDVSDLTDVRRCAQELSKRLERVDVLVHNAGVLPASWTGSADGHEVTMATHVLGPVLLTELLLPLLRGHGSRVVFVSSGGMYTQSLPVSDPGYRRGRYRGPVAYARSKRVQVALTPVLQERWGSAGVQVHSMHPGWVDTPGVSSSLPTFNRVMGPLLRDAEQGADTIVWLAATRPAPPGGQFWHDRAPRPMHYGRLNRESEDELAGMWHWVRTEAGLDQ